MVIFFFFFETPWHKSVKNGYFCSTLVPGIRPRLPSTLGVSQAWAADAHRPAELAPAAPRLALSRSSPPGIINTHILRVIHTYVQPAAGGAVPQLRRERTGKQLGLKTQQTLHIYVEGTVIFTFNTPLGLMES